MRDCITAMETMFRDLAEGRILQPLRSLIWLPDRSGLLGMMPGYAQGPNIIGVKLITVFHANGPAGLPSHQGIVILFEASHGTPLLLLEMALAGEVALFISNDILPGNFACVAR